MALIPFILEVAGVAPNSGAAFVLTTPGVTWSMSDRDDESIGFSYNALSIAERRNSSIQRIEFTGSTLAFRTGSSISQDPITLTLFVDVPQGIKSIGGYCDINDGAHVTARFGSALPVDWFSGQFNYVLSPRTDVLTQVCFTLSGLRANEAVQVSLRPGQDGQPIGWLLPFQGSGGLRVWTVQGSAVPLRSLTLKSNDMLFVAASDSAAVRKATILIELHVRCLNQSAVLSEVLLSACSEKSSTVTARFGARRPVRLSECDTSFRLAAPKVNG